ncbi:hypothetical protein H4219_002043 [Mycoemilia scoparia]|uniref:Uncharacterized protein n=1 Tax=Mycoemilia scoparia TaxID=417184 RepID=A0A9W7ZYP3_9FUNG|nr:hypothetical protein H4219_002043 [Mycoemilia scoparia]
MMEDKKKRSIKSIVYEAIPSTTFGGNTSAKRQRIRAKNLWKRVTLQFFYDHRYIPQVSEVSYNFLAGEFHVSPKEIKTRMNNLRVRLGELIQKLCEPKDWIDEPTLSRLMLAGPFSADAVTESRGRIHGHGKVRLGRDDDILNEIHLREVLGKGYVEPEYYRVGQPGVGKRKLSEQRTWLQEKLYEMYGESAPFLEEHQRPLYDPNQYFIQRNHSEFISDINNEGIDFIYKRGYEEALDGSGPSAGALAIPGQEESFKRGRYEANEAGAAGGFGLDFNQTPYMMSGTSQSLFQAATPAPYYAGAATYYPQQYEAASAAGGGSGNYNDYMTPFMQPGSVSMYNGSVAATPYLSQPQRPSYFEGSVVPEAHSNNYNYMTPYIGAKSHNGRPGFDSFPMLPPIETHSNTKAAPSSTSYRGYDDANNGDSLQLPPLVHNLSSTSANSNGTDATLVGGGYDHSDPAKIGGYQHSKYASTCYYGNDAQYGASIEPSATELLSSVKYSEKDNGGSGNADEDTSSSFYYPPASLLDSDALNGGASYNSSDAVPSSSAKPIARGRGRPRGSTNAKRTTKPTTSDNA